MTISFGNKVEEVKDFDFPKKNFEEFYKSSNYINIIG